MKKKFTILELKLKENSILESYYMKMVIIVYQLIFLCYAFNSKSIITKKDYETGKQKGILDGLNQYFVHQEGFNLNIYKNFARTQDLRQEVDYQAQDYISKEIALEKMEECEEFIVECEKFF